MKDFLKEKRKETNLDVDGMAKRLGVSSIAIYQYESGKRFPHATQLIKFAEAYQLSDQELIQWLKYINEKNK